MRHLELVLLALVWVPLLAVFAWEFGLRRSALAFRARWLARRAEGLSTARRQRLALALQAVAFAPDVRSGMLRISTAPDVRRMGRSIAKRCRLPLEVRKDMPPGAIWLSAVDGTRRLDIEIGDPADGPQDLAELRRRFPSDPELAAELREMFSFEPVRDMPVATAPEPSTEVVELARTLSARLDGRLCRYCGAESDRRLPHEHATGKCLSAAKESTDAH